jgi:hypothetical protein
MVAFPKLWNEHQDEITKSEPNKSLFNSNLKEFFISKLNENYICTRLLCPFAT